MNKNSTQKKESFTADHGFVFMEKWPAAIRWVLILPVAFISFIFVNNLTNWAIKISEAEWFVSVCSFIFHTLATAIFIYYGAATAPKSRKVVMTILSIVMIFSSVAIYLIPQERSEVVDLSLTAKILNFVSVIVGIAIVYFGWMTKKDPIITENSTDNAVIAENPSEDFKG